MVTKSTSKILSIFEWLDNNNLTANSNEFWYSGSQQFMEDEPLSLLSSTEISKFRQPQINNEQLKKQRKKKEKNFNELPVVNKVATINFLLDKNSKYVFKKRVPPDAIAFYRPFHFSPIEEWGIYFNDDIALMQVASRVMPSGYTSLFAKPDIPVYFMGKNEEYNILLNMLPNSKAAYAYLEFPFTTEEFSAKIKEEKEKRKEIKKGAGS